MAINRTIILPVLIATMMLATFSYAGSANASLKGYLSTYISNATIGGSAYFNQSVSSTHYVIMQLNGTGNNYVVLKVNPSNYSFVTDASTAFSVLRPYFNANFKLNQTLVSQLGTSMNRFIAPAQYNITDCLVETGLALGSTCTLANACISCQFSPVCRTVMNQAGGVYSPMGFGIINYSIRYNAFNASTTSYYAALASLKNGTIDDNVGKLGADIAAIYNSSISLPEVPIVAFGNNFDYSLLQGCNVAGNPLTMTWYCADNITGD
ncbi:MAG: hypothetical protein KGH66_02465, partial [Candidatus Micrarchaeota archaeon]|nr:hypothetical protein [Candidatus Micrarchaeota archaeon]